MAGYGEKDALVDDAPSAGGYGANDRPVDAGIAAPGFIPTVKRTGGQMLTTLATSIDDITGPNKVTKSIKDTGQGIIDRNPAGINGIGDIVDSPWLATKEAVGQFVPQIGAAAAGGIAGAAAGKRIAGAPGAAVGGIAGSLAPIFSQEYGGIRQDQQEAGKNDIPRALGTAAIATGLERVGMGKFLHGFGGAAAKSIPGEIAKGVLKEGGTEAAQNVVEQVGAFKDPTTRENLADTAFAGAMGGIGGGVVSGGHAGVNRALAPKDGAPVVSPEVAPPVVAPVDPVAPVEAVAPVVAPLAGDPLRTTKLPEGGALSKAVNIGVEQEAAAADAGAPVAAPITGALAGVSAEDAPHPDTPTATAEAPKQNGSVDGGEQGPTPPAAQAAQPQAPTAAPTFDPETGEILQPQRGSFPTRDGVEQYLSQQRLNGGTRMGKAIPVELPDKTFSFVREGEPGFIEAGRANAEALAAEKAKAKGEPVKTEAKPLIGLQKRRALAAKERANAQRDVQPATRVVEPAADGSGDQPSGSRGDSGRVPDDAPRGDAAVTEAFAPSSRADAPVEPASASPAPVAKSGLRERREKAVAEKKAKVERETSPENTARIIKATKPIDAKEAAALVEGKTEKPGGVNPSKMVGAGAGNGREYRIGDVPLDLFVANEAGDRYDGTVDLARAKDYASRDAAGAPPVIATQGRTGTQLRINDGGHRITAARLRGDTSIRALVAVRSAKQEQPATNTTTAAGDSSIVANNGNGETPGPGKAEAPQANSSVLQLQREWSAAAQAGDTEKAKAINDQIVAAKKAAKGEAVAEAPAAEAAKVEAPTPERGEQDRQGLRAEDRAKRDLDSNASELASQMVGDLREGDFDPTEARPGLDLWASKSKIASDDLRSAVVKIIRSDTGLKAAERETLLKSLDPTRGATLAARRDEAKAADAPAPAPAPKSFKERREAAKPESKSDTLMGQTEVDRRAAIDAETMETRKGLPEIAQPMPGKNVVVVSRTLNGVKRVRAQIWEAPGYNGPQLAVAEYKSPRAQGYRVYMVKSGALAADNNGVKEMDRNETLKLAINRVQNARDAISARAKAKPAAEAKPEPVPATPSEKPAGKASEPATPALAQMPAVAGISREAAYNAHRGTSHVPEDRAVQEQQSFTNTLRNAWDRAAAIAGDDQAAVERITAAFQELADGYRQRYTAKLGASSRVMSTMIAGAGNFPVRRNEKANAVADKRAGEAEDFLKKGIARLLKAAKAPIDNSPTSELERVQANLAEREALQVKMKAANVALRKGDDAALSALGFSETQIADLRKPDFAGRLGFPDYRLTNNNAEIRRLRERLANSEQRVADAAAGPTERTFAGVTIKEDATDDRIRLLFDGKPDEAVRADLKANGFKWSPTNEAWQRRLTDNARRAAEAVLQKHYAEAAADTAFKRGADHAAAANIERTQNLVESITSKWSNSPSVTVLVDMADPRVPQSVRNADATQKSQGATGEPAAFVNGGKVYLVASQLKTDEQATEALYHEALGHIGLRGVFGDRLDEVLDKMARLNASQVKLKAAQYGLNFNDPRQRRMAAEEVLAELAQKSPQVGWVKQAIAAVRGWLRENVSAFKDMKYSDADIAAKFLAPARDYIVKGSKDFADTQPMVKESDPHLRDEGGRFSRGLSDSPNPISGSGKYASASRAIDSLKSGEAPRAIMKALSNTSKDNLGLGLQFLGRRQIVEIYGNRIEGLNQYNDEMQKYDAAKNESASTADELVKNWAKVSDGDAMSDVMHDATRMGFDPAVSESATPEEAGLKKRFDALSPEAKQTYIAARDGYRDHWAKVQSAIEARIERSQMAGKEKRAMIDESRQQFQKAIQGVYFPLARFGDYYITVKDAGGKVLSSVRAESLNEAEKRRADLTRDFPDAKVSKVLKSAEYNAAQDSVSRGFIEKLFAMADSTALTGEDATIFKDSINQLYLSSLPDASWAKTGMHRKGTPGYSKDARRAFASNMFHGGYHLAKLEHGDILGDRISQMQKFVNGKKDDAAYDSVAAQRVVDEMVKRHDLAMNPPHNALASLLTAAGFMWHMGMSPASAVVNLSQNALVAYPMMGAKFGYAKTAKAFAKIGQETAQAKNDLRGKLSKDENAALDLAIKEGIIDVTQAHDLAGVAEGQQSKMGEGLSKFMKAASWMFHHAEKFNRQTTFIATYRLARESGQAQDVAFATARKMTYDSHFDLSQGNRPRVMAGPAMRVLTLFKQFGQNMMYILARNAHQSLKGETPEVRKEARKVLAGLLTAHGLFAGAFGLPLVGMLLGLASALGGDDDEPWDAKTALRNYLADAVGKDVAEVLVHGIFRALIPADISSRVGLDSMLFRDIDTSLEPNKVWQSLVETILGPVVGIGVNVAKGANDMARGDFARGAESMVPKFISDPLKAMRFAREGAVDKTGVEILKDLTPAEIAARAIGFTPSRMSESYEGKNAVMSTKRELDQRRAGLLREFSKAVIDKDTEARDQAMQSIQKFNKAQPHDAITMQSMRSSVTTRQKNIAQAQDGIVLPKKQRGMAELGHFANTN